MVFHHDLVSSERYHDSLPPLPELNSVIILHHTIRFDDDPPASRDRISMDQQGQTARAVLCDSAEVDGPWRRFREGRHAKHVFSAEHFIDVNLVVSKRSFDIGVNLNRKIHFGIINDGLIPYFNNKHAIRNCATDRFGGWSSHAARFPPHLDPFLVPRRDLHIFAVHGDSVDFDLDLVFTRGNRDLCGALTARPFDGTYLAINGDHRLCRQAVEDEVTVGGPHPENTRQPRSDEPEEHHPGRDRRPDPRRATHGSRGGRDLSVSPDRSTARLP